MGSKQELMQRATGLLREAVAADSPGREPEALALYVEATSALFSVVKLEEKPERKAKWTQQLTQYLERRVSSG